jgi:cytochrome b6-f complex iron-sulfur subunit
MSEFIAGAPARRVFLGTTLAAGTAAALAACGQGGSEGVPEATGEAVEAGTTADLPVGGRRSVALQGGKYLLYRPDEATVLAYSSVCTHQGCEVGVGNSEVFQCPCHGSEFSNKDGQRVAGPAKDPLTRYAAEIDGDKIIVYL